MAPHHRPPGNLHDFERGQSPQALYDAWAEWISVRVAEDPDRPAWYDSTNPPSAAAPAGKAPPWTGLPRTALLLNGNDVLAAAAAVDAPVEFGTATDALLVDQPPFLDSHGHRVAGFKYRPQDEYLEWVTKIDPDGIVREVWFTCEGPEYWDLIAKKDPALLIQLYAEIMGVAKTQIDPKVLYFQQDCTHVERFAQNQKLTFKKDDYNPYNAYNIEAAIHLTQGANSLGAEIALAKDGSLIWGTPPKTVNPDLICCARYGEANRFSDPTIGKQVNDLARQGSFVTLRDPIGLYIDSIDSSNFTDDGDSQLANLQDFFVPIRKSDDGEMILRAVFRVPAGVQNKAGVQARVGDLKYLGKSITKGGQIANAVNMHLFAQALPGAPLQIPQKCTGHACPTPSHPGFIVTTPINMPCQADAAPHLSAHLEFANAAFAELPEPSFRDPSRILARG